MELRERAGIGVGERPPLRGRRWGLGGGEGAGRLLLWGGRLLPVVYAV